MKTTIKGPNGFSPNDTTKRRQIRIELDSEQIFPNDPGQGTPAMVILTEGTRKQEIGTATFGCAVVEREVDGWRLSDEHAFWLNTQIDVVDEFITKHTRNA